MASKVPDSDSSDDLKNIKENWSEFEEVDVNYLDLQGREGSISDFRNSKIDLDLENDGLDGNFPPSFTDNGRSLEILSSRQYLTEGSKLGTNTPLTGPHVAHYGFDYAQQVHYPANPQQPGPLYFKTTRMCALFGVVCDTFPAQVNYLIDETACSTKGANSVISYIHQYLETYCLDEEKALFHADNCWLHEVQLRLLLWLAKKEIQN
ncbi:uncharacterized protein [Watersipora subatra]|uniref:uncharacterized protein n=1 Tax=Watersipora subatra TaxID=2589382 RepID=UPI00355B05DA